MISQERQARMRAFLEQTITIHVDRPRGTGHPEHPDLIYPVHYGFLPGVPGGDGEEQDVYLLGVTEPVLECTAQVIGIIYRENDTEDKLVAAPAGLCFHQAQIAEAVHFQERFFQSRVEAVYHRSCGAVIFRRRNGQMEYLCLREIPSGAYSVPKGHMEAFETEEQTAAREIREETGLSVRFLPGFREEMYYEACDDIHIYKTVVLFLAEFSGALRLAPREISAYQWLDLTHAKQTLPGTCAPVLDRAERFLNP